MDPIRNPYAPGAGQRPPELAGRDRELEQLAVTLRTGRGRPARAEHGAQRPAGCGQDGAAQRAARPGGAAGVGHRQDRGPPRPEHPDPGRPGGAPPRSARSATATATPTASVRWPAWSRRSRCGPPWRTAAGCAGRRRSTYPPPRAVPTAATSSSTSPSCSSTWPRWPATSGSASPCSSTRCRTSRPPSSPRSAVPATRSASRRRRCCWSGPGCRTCRSRSRRPSPTPSGCSATSSWTA